MALEVTGQGPHSPVGLTAGGACGTAADGGLSSRRAKGRKVPEKISGEGQASVADSQRLMISVDDARYCS